MSKIFYTISSNISRENIEKNVNLFIISAPFDLLQGIQSRIKSYIQIILFEISKNLGKSFVTHILLAEEQTTKKSI